MFPCIVAFIVVLSAAIQLFFNFYFFSRSFRIFQKPVAENDTVEVPVLHVSVVICAFNEEQALRKNLPVILNQQYDNIDGEPLYEVIVVNDRSDDGTGKVLQDLQNQHPHLKIVTISKEESRTFPGKKFALSKGIAVAKNDVLLMTDADCKPAGNAWISAMAAPFSHGRAIVAGYGAYERTTGFLNLFIRAETIHTYLQYLSYTLAGMPYMAVGRNLACRKTLLQQAQASELWQQTPSGDDDLLMTLFATRENTFVNTDPASFTISQSKGSWKEYVHQKQRHFSTGKYYHPRVQAFLGLYALSHSLFWLGTFSFFFSAYWYALLPGSFFEICLAAIVLRCILTWTILAETAVANAESLRFFWPVFDVGWMFYNLLFSPYIFLKNKKTWR